MPISLASSIEIDTIQDFVRVGHETTYAPHKGRKPRGVN
jgi:hypothetical protein